MKEYLKHFIVFEELVQIFHIIIRRKIAFLKAQGVIHKPRQLWTPSLPFSCSCCLGMPFWNYLKFHSPHIFINVWIFSTFYDITSFGRFHFSEVTDIYTILHRQKNCTCTCIRVILIRGGRKYSFWRGMYRYGRKYGCND